MNKKSFILILLLSCIFLFTGCFNIYGHVDEIYAGNNDIPKGARGLFEPESFVILSNLDDVKVALDLTNKVKSYKYTFVVKNSENDKNPMKTLRGYECTNRINSTQFQKLHKMDANKIYEYEVKLYEGENCTGKGLGSVPFNIYTYSDSEDPVKISYTSVEAIEGILKSNGFSYTNVSAGEKIACSYYGISDEKENVPLCLALARVGAASSNSAEFVKQTLTMAGISVSGSVYEYSVPTDSYPKPTDPKKYVAPPQSMANGGIVAFKNNGVQANIGILFYDAQRNDWYVVNGNFAGGKVQLQPLSYILRYTSWDGETANYTEYYYMNI